MLPAIARLRQRPTLVRVPKIDWSDDDQPTWEPRYRPLRRERFVRPRFLGSSGRLDSLPLVFRQALSEPAAPQRRPLHMIWGEPNRSESSP
jgi:hypothetical protein